MTDRDKPRLAPVGELSPFCRAVPGRTLTVA
jgi:hypothetical protein